MRTKKTNDAKLSGSRRAPPERSARASAPAAKPPRVRKAIAKPRDVKRIAELLVKIDAAQSQILALQAKLHGTEGALTRETNRAFTLAKEKAALLLTVRLLARENVAVSVSLAAQGNSGGGVNAWVAPAQGAPVADPPYGTTAE